MALAISTSTAPCIRHAQQDARRAALRKKHAPLNYSVPLPAAEESTDTAPAANWRPSRGINHLAHLP